MEKSYKLVIITTDIPNKVPYEFEMFILKRAQVIQVLRFNVLSLNPAYQCISFRNDNGMA